MYLFHVGNPGCRVDEPYQTSAHRQGQHEQECLHLSCVLIPTRYKQVRGPLLCLGQVTYYRK